jgi:hypothetical protein
MSFGRKIKKKLKNVQKKFYVNVESGQNFLFSGCPRLPMGWKKNLRVTRVCPRADFDFSRVTRICTRASFFATDKALEIRNLRISISL